MCVDEELIEKIAELADSCVGTDINMCVDGFDLDEFTQELRVLLTQKRTVTREWVEATIRELENALEPAHAECILEERLLDAGIKTDGGQICEDEKEEQPLMDKETAGDKKFHELKDEDRLDEFGRRKQ